MSVIIKLFNLSHLCAHWWHYQADEHRNVTNVAVLQISFWRHPRTVQGRIWRVNPQNSNLQHFQQYFSISVQLKLLDFLFTRSVLWH